MTNSRRIAVDQTTSDDRIYFYVTTQLTQNMHYEILGSVHYDPSRPRDEATIAFAAKLHALDDNISDVTLKRMMGDDDRYGISESFYGRYGLSDMRYEIHVSPKWHAELRPDIVDRVIEAIIFEADWSPDSVTIDRVTIPRGI